MPRDVAGRRVVIVGGSPLQVPAIRTARRMGLRVAVVDIDPLAPGAALADEFHHVSTRDAEGVLEVARRFGADGVMTMATDAPMVVIAAVTTELGLPGPAREVAHRATDKLAMVEAFHRHGVPAPSYWSLDDTASATNLVPRVPIPCIVKPADSSGSRGVVLVQQREDLPRAVTESISHSPSGRVVVQSFLLGDVISVEAFVIDGTTHVIAVTDKQTTGAPGFVETAHQQPSALDRSTMDEVVAVAERATAALGIINGPAHIEMMCTDNGVVVIELGARLGGDFIASHLVPLSTGVDLVEATLRQAVGAKPNLQATRRGGSAVVYLCADRMGTLRTIEGFDEASACQGVVDVMRFVSPGDVVRPPRASGERLAAVLTRSAQPGQALADGVAALARLRTEIS